MTFDRLMVRYLIGLVGMVALQAALIRWAGMMEWPYPSVVATWVAMASAATWWMLRPSGGGA